MEAASSNSISLEIQGTLIKCDRADLIKNSDYFKAMLEGNFVESSKNIIPLNGVDFVAMNTILKMLWDREYTIEKENILSVLQAACMLQFLEIKQTCIKRLQNMLSINNCLKIWLYTEHLDLKDIYLKAKLMALMQFMTVKDTDYFLELSLEEVVNYLGNVNLQCSSEILVFKAIIKWYHNLGEKNDDVLFKLIRCLDFTRFTKEEIAEIIASPHIKDSQQLVDIFQCNLYTKNNTNSSNFQDNCKQNRNSLSKCRNLQGFPCILVDNLGTEQEKNMSKEVLYYDRFKRKRKYNVLEYCSNTAPTVICIDVKTANLKRLFDMNPQKCASLDGFKMIGYKHYIYLYGGEYLLGKGNWNCTFYMYDIIQEKWKQKESLPFPRRHFESCICGNYLFIVGGTGPFRVIQENMFWYNFDSDKWSKEERLPCSGRQIKCCPFNGKLFILNINNKCGYMFCPDRGNWTKFNICDADNVLPYYSKNLSVFSYKNSLYAKERKLYELKQQESNFVIVNQIVLPEVQKTTCQVESVLCNNVMYSLNKQWCEETTEQIISLESFDVETYATSYNFRKTPDEILTVDNEMFKFRSSLMIFNVFHQNLLDENDLINDYIC